MQKDLIASIRKELRLNAENSIRDSGRRFFKEEVRLYGVKAAFVTKLAQKYFREIRGLGKEEVFGLCEALLESDYCEEAFIAFEWSYGVRAEYEPGDFRVFERWLESYVNNWAKCDTLCNHSVGFFVEKYPVFIKNLKCWTRSENRWFRRASAVTLVLPARHGKFLRDVFEISDRLLHDKDDLVRKGYGWLLKEASKAHMDEVFSFVMDRKKDMPRTSLRYAIEKMPKDLRSRAMR